MVQKEEVKKLSAVNNDKLVPINRRSVCKYVKLEVLHHGDPQVLEYLSISNCNQVLKEFFTIQQCHSSKYRKRKFL